MQLETPCISVERLSRGRAMRSPTIRLRFPLASRRAGTLESMPIARRSFASAQCATLEPAAFERHESLEQLRALWHGRIVVLDRPTAPDAGVDTPADLPVRARRG